MTKYVQAMVTGIGTGAVYALVAYGISLVYAVTRTVNLAHGEVMMTAVFASLTALTYGAAAWLAIAAGLGAAALLGLVLDRVVMTPLAGRREPMSWFLGVVMFAAVLRGAATLLFGSRTYPLPIDIGGDAIIRLGGAAFKATYVWILGLALVLAAAFQVLVARTAFGRAVRTIAESPPAAALAGVNVPRVRLTVFVLASVTGAAAGLVFAPLTFVGVQLGFLYTFKGFVAAVIGGLGSGGGALAGGLLVGLLERLLATALPGLATGIVDAAAFGLAVMVLIVAPQGLAGRREVARR